VGHTIVVMTIGGNDFASSVLGGDPAGAPLDAAMANLREIVAYLQNPANFPDGTSIFITTVYDPTDGQDQASACFLGFQVPGVAAALDVWRQRYLELGAELGFAVVDSIGHFRGHGWHATETANPYYHSADPTLWFSDCVHPNDRGHHELRQLFFEAIAGGGYSAD
jgi:lysophospholipase L1-like esterase